MKLKLVCILMSLGVFSVSDIGSAGNMGSAGPVTLKPIVTCTTYAMNSAFPSKVKSLSISKATEYSGDIDWQDPTLTVVTYDLMGEELSYLILEEKPLRVGSNINLKVLRYRPGTEGNTTLGKLQISFDAKGIGSGTLSFGLSRIEEMSLKCRWLKL